jgi:short subunit dehydrogenase-like uncharacterized protein
LDIVVFGATGFVGRLVAEYLVEHAPAGVTIGLAGRSEAKLEALGLDCPLVVADAANPEVVARSARVVATTVGPYRRYGRGLVGACIEHNTHYCDLTGEVLFVHDTIKRHAEAERAGVKIVHSTGFDSIPSDLGTFLLHDAAGELTDTTLVVKALKGGFSGGTLASLKGQLDEMKTDTAVRKVIGDPHALSPETSGDERDLRMVKRDAEHGWIGPFVMAGYNTRIVRRSAALLDYGPNFRYQEVSGYGNPVTAIGTTCVLGALAGGLAFGPTRAVLDRVLPDPGEGPSEKSRTNGYFRVEVHGAGHTATVAAKGDPGYNATARMMGETALALALDDLPDRAGVLTPASALGMPLVERLRAAGMTLAVAAAR